MSSYLSASPVVCADGDYPFSSIHVTPRISSSITRSARVEWTARHKFASFPKCGRTRPPRPPPSWYEVELCSAPSAASPCSSGGWPVPLEGRRSTLSRRTRVSALGVFPSQSAVLLAEPRAPLADLCTAATRLTQKLSATAPFVCWLVSFKNPGNDRSLV